MAQVLCVGEALVDRLGPLGGDPLTAPLEQCDDRLGGAPANVACALARLGTSSAFIGRLGRDSIGEAFEVLFRGRGVDVGGLQWDPQRPTRIVLVQRDPAGERSFGGFTGDRGQGFADQALAVELLAPRFETLMAGASWLLTGTIPLATPAAAAALQSLVSAAAAAGVALAVDVNWRPTFWDPQARPDAGPSQAVQARLLPLLEQAALVKCAAEEAQWLFGTTEPGRLSQALPQRPMVLITDGARPLRWCMGGQVGQLPAYTVAVVDTTGAGDAFTAGVLHALCRYPAWSPEHQLRFALACGALVCSGAGAIDPQPDEPAVFSFLEAATEPDAPAQDLAG